MQGVQLWSNVSTCLVDYHVCNEPLHLTCNTCNKTTWRYACTCHVPVRLSAYASYLLRPEFWLSARQDSAASRGLDFTQFDAQHVIRLAPELLQYISRERLGFNWPPFMAEV